MIEVVGVETRRYESGCVVIDAQEVYGSAKQCNLVRSEFGETITNIFTHDRRIVSKVDWIQQPVEVQLGEAGDMRTERYFELYKVNQQSTSA